jgi:hypothetical protein
VKSGAELFLVAMTQKACMPYPTVHLGSDLQMVIVWIDESWLGVAIF